MPNGTQSIPRLLLTCGKTSSRLLSSLLNSMGYADERLLHMRTQRGEREREKKSESAVAVNGVGRGSAEEGETDGCSHFLRYSAFKAAHCSRFSCCADVQKCELCLASLTISIFSHFFFFYPIMVPPLFSPPPFRPTSTLPTHCSLKCIQSRRHQNLVRSPSNSPLLPSFLASRV